MKTLLVLSAVCGLLLFPGRAAHAQAIYYGGNYCTPSRAVWFGGYPGYAYYPYGYAWGFGGGYYRPYWRGRGYYNWHYRRGWGGGWNRGHGWGRGRWAH